MLHADDNALVLVARRPVALADHQLRATRRQRRRRAVARRQERAASVALADGIAVDAQADHPLRCDHDAAAVRLGNVELHRRAPDDDRSAFKLPVDPLDHAQVAVEGRYVDDAGCDQRQHPGRAVSDGLRHEQEQQRLDLPLLLGVGDAKAGVVLGQRQRVAAIGVGLRVVPAVDLHPVAPRQQGRAVPSLVVGDEQVIDVGVGQDGRELLRFRPERRREGRVYGRVGRVNAEVVEVAPRPLRFLRRTLADTADLRPLERALLSESCDRHVTYPLTSPGGRESFRPPSRRACWPRPAPAPRPERG